MNTHLFAQLAREEFNRKWNSIVPRKAVRVERGEGGWWVLHATKGWRFISDRRLG